MGFFSPFILDKTSVSDRELQIESLLSPSIFLDEIARKRLLSRLKIFSQSRNPNRYYLLILIPNLNSKGRNFRQ